MAHVAATKAPKASGSGLFPSFRFRDVSREELLELVRAGTAHALPWSALPMRSSSMSELYGHVSKSQGAKRERELALLGKLVFLRATASGVEKPCLYTEISTRFVSDFATRADHACFLLEYGALDYLHHMCKDWDADKVLACTWELLLTLCTAACPAHFERMLCSPLFEHVCVALRKVNCVTKETVYVSSGADKNGGGLEMAWCASQSAEATRVRREECDEYRHQVSFSLRCAQ